MECKRDFVFFCKTKPLLRIYAIFLSLNTLFWFGAKAQQLSRHNTFSYNVNEGLLQTAMLDMAVDKNNYCWISFPNGIQKFDGKNFISVPAQPGLPDDKGVYFFRIGSGELLVSHAGGISHYNSNNNRFTLLVNENVSSKRSQFLGEENGVIYYYNKNGNIVGLDNHTYKTVYHMPAGWQPPNNYYRMGENIINQKAAVLVDSAVYLLDLKTKRILYKPVIIRGISFYFLVLKNEEEILFFQRKGKSYALQLYNFKSEKTKTLRIAEENSIGFRGNIYQWQGKQLLAVFNRLYQVDNDYKEITAEIVNFQNEPVGPSAITRIREDNYGNLLVGTINAGIRKIIRNNYPVKYYGVPQEKNNYIISLLPDKQTGRVFAGTLSNGLFVFDTLQQPVKHIRILPNKKQNFSVQAIVKSPHGDYFLFVGTERVIWKLSSDLRTLTPVKIKTTLAGKENSVSYFTKVIACNKKEALVQSQPFLYRLDFETNTVTQAEISASHPMSALLYEQSILVHTNDSLYYLDSRTLQTTRVIFFPATGSVRCYESEGDRIYIGSNKGIFMIEGDGRVQNHLTKETGLPDECIYAMSLDKEGRLWCSTNRGIFGLGKDNSILQLTKTDGLQENEFNNNAVAQAGDGELFFGGVNGISSFYPSAINPYIDNPALLITEVKINNETYKSNNAVWAVETITVPHNQNSFSFDFIAMGASNPDQYIYQYKMGGIDKEWIQNDGAQTVRYYLPPGHYVFAVSASRIFDKNAKALKEIVIVVQQPFWKRPWFIAGGAVLLLVLLAFIIYLSSTLGS